MRHDLAAAHEINKLWMACMDRSHVDLAGCPTDEEVAEIIRKHIEEPIEER